MSIVEIWTIIGGNSALLTVTGFLLKQWISRLKTDHEESREDFHRYREETDKQLFNMKNELGKRKGETELLRKDLELLSSETRKNFEAVNIHMNYQKTALDEIKNSIISNGRRELDAITELIQMMKKKS